MTNRKTVLIVEDDALIRLVLADTMIEAGFVVIEACDALEAIAVLGSIHVDATITDVDMPGALNGLHLATMTSRIFPRMLTVVNSGRSDVETELPEGTVFFLKPAAPADLTRVVADALSDTDAQLRGVG